MFAGQRSPMIESDLIQVHSGCTGAALLRRSVWLIALVELHRRHGRLGSVGLMGVGAGWLRASVEK